MTYASLAAAVYGDRLYVMWVDNTNRFVYSAASTDGINWVVGNDGNPISSYQSNTGITAAVWYGRIYLFFKRQEAQPRHYYATFNGSEWATSVEVGPPYGAWTPYADSAAVYGNKLWLFGIGTDNTHWYNNYDGHNWSGWTQVDGGGTTAVPTNAITYNNRLHLFGIGTGDHQHYVNVYDGTSWSNWYRIPGLVSSTASDTATVFQDKLWLFSVSMMPEGRHWFSGCLGDPSCGGGVDTGDAVLYSGAGCTGSSVKLTAPGWSIPEGATRSNLMLNPDVTGQTFPDGTPLSQMRCVWVRSGYQLTLCTGPGLGLGCVDYPGDNLKHGTLPGGIYSLELARARTALWGGQPREYLGWTFCGGSGAWNENFQSITHSDTHFLASRSDAGRITRYPITASTSDFCTGWGDKALGLPDAHLGTLVYFRDPGKAGYLYVEAGSTGLQLYDEDLNLILDEVPNSGWGPINPVDGLTYAFGGGKDWDYTVRVSKRVYDPEDSPYPTRLEYQHSFNLAQYYTPPNPKTLRCVQGADFSPQGFLYLASEGSNRSWDGYCDDNSQDAGIYVFSLVGGASGQVAWFENRIVIMPADSSYEAQAMVVWDTDVRSDVVPWAGFGQLHYAVRINNWDWPNYDDVIVYHYRVPPWTW